MALYILGLGLGSLDYVTLGVLNRLKMCSEVYLDSYTSFISRELLEWLEKELGEKLKIAVRKNLEDNIDEILEKAVHRNVAILVPGDPFIATTHISIIVKAREKKVDYEILHGVSAYSAAPSITGLHIYKFGRTITLPREGDPKEVYRAIQDNMEKGLHTLILLDTADGGLTIPEALIKLLSVEESLGRKILNEDSLAIALVSLGMSNQLIKVGTIKELLSVEYPPPPHMLIFPGELHFTEIEILIKIHGAREDIVRKYRPPRYEKDRTLNYITKTRRVLKELKINEDSKHVKDVLEIAESYVEDSYSYWSSGEIYNALATIAYAEGLLDGLRIVGKISFKW
ncbi:MAG: diphthine synthase [Nitrososphaerota archaeon]